MGFAPFNSIFMRNRSLVTLGDFTVKNAKLGREMWCAADIRNYTCHICAKGFLDLNFNQAVINKISNFHEISHFHENRNL